MAAGKAGVSASGAAMSKYDVEVEARLKKIEAEIAEIKKGLAKHSGVGGGDVGARLDELVTKLSRKMKL
tara:strand:- start:218 stop:424 length:207 start_codon:yes stop_codon:yes gene_type:complete